MKKPHSHLGQRQNSHLAITLELHRRVCGMLDGPLRVLDCCAGGGHIWTALKRELNVETYLPIDLIPQFPGTLRMDSRDALKVMNLEQFNVIDVDTFGEPWDYWMTICKRIGPTPTAVFLTHGHIGIGGGGVSLWIMKIMGVPAAWAIRGGPSWAKLSASYVLTEGCRSVTILSAWKYDSSRIDYYGLLLQGAKPT